MVGWFFAACITSVVATTGLHGLSPLHVCGLIEVDLVDVCVSQATK